MVASIDIVGRQAKCRSACTCAYHSHSCVAYHCSTLAKKVANGRPSLLAWTGVSWSSFLCIKAASWCLHQSIEKGKWSNNCIRVVLTGARQSFWCCIKLKKESREREDYRRRRVASAVPGRFALRACHVGDNGSVSVCAAHAFAGMFSSVIHSTVLVLSCLVLFEFLHHSVTTEKRVAVATMMPRCARTVSFWAVIALMATALVSLCDASSREEAVIPLSIDADRSVRVLTVGAQECQHCSLAAVEVARYLYAARMRTMRRRAPSVVHVSNDMNVNATLSGWIGHQVVIAPRGSWLHATLGHAHEMQPCANDNFLNAAQHSIRSVPPTKGADGAWTYVLSGATPISTLYAAYSFAEDVLGVRFYPHGDVVPEAAAVRGSAMSIPAIGMRECVKPHGHARKQLVIVLFTLRVYSCVCMCFNVALVENIW